jgi:hypothetical protein
MKPIVLVVCGDAGGAAAIAPVVARLKMEGRLNPRSLASRYAAPALQSYNLDVEDLLEVPSMTVAESYFRNFCPALLITGTTWGPEQPEKPFLAMSRAFGVPSLTVLDFWTNYRARFDDETGALAYLPDRIAVMDALAQREMLAEGFPPEILIVTGAPHLDSLSSVRATFTIARRTALRTRLGVGEKELLVLFASQPVSELYGESLGYTEQRVLALLIAALDALAQRDQVSLTLALRPHPRENIDKFSGVRPAHVRIATAADGSGRDWAMASDLVVGMISALLLEACYLGCLTVSLQPNLTKSDMLPTNRSRLSLPVYAEEEIGPTLREALLNEEFRREQRVRLGTANLPEGATQNVVKLAYQMCHTDFPEVFS